MAITLFGLLWILLLLWGFLKKSDKYMITLTLLSSVFQCNSVIKLSNTSGVGPLIVTSIIFIARYMYVNRRKLRIQIDSYFLFGSMTVLAILLSLITNGEKFGGTKGLYILQIVIYVCTLLCMRHSAKKMDEYHLIHCILIPIMFVLVQGIIQVGITARVIPKFGLFGTLFYNETWSSNTAYYASSRIRLFSTFKEPSYCAAFLVGSLYYICFNYKKIKHSKCIILLIVTELILTMSTTGYAAALICGVAFLLYGRKEKLITHLLPVAIIALIIIVFTGIFDSVILNKLQTGSAYERGMWNDRAVRDFIQSPICGVGYKNSRASSLLLSLLAEQGILGGGVFIAFVVAQVSSIIKYNKSNLELGCKWFFIAVVVCQFIACPDLDFCVLWFGMYIVALSHIISRNNMINEDKEFPI